MRVVNSVWALADAAQYAAVRVPDKKKLCTIWQGGRPAIFAEMEKEKIAPAKAKIALASGVILVPKPAAETKRKLKYVPKGYEIAGAPARGIMENREWRKEEIAFLKEAYPVFGSLPVAQRLRRTTRAVRSKARKLGVRWEGMQNTLSDVFRRCSIDEKTGCWQWLGKTMNSVPIVSQPGGASVSLRRKVWDMCYGRVPSNCCIKVKCKCALCLNPAHLTIYKKGGGDVSADYS